MKQSPLHPRNRHRGQYDFTKLVEAVPELKAYMIQNPKGQPTINFFDPLAVKLLNKALLAYHYNIQYWDIPDGYLCPPIPGRAEYLHRISDMFSQSEGKDNKIKTVLDIGTGANCIYPIIGSAQYKWKVVGSDIGQKSLANAKVIVEQNPSIRKLIQLRLQQNPTHIFKGIIHQADRFDVTLCNPPFHRSQQEARQGSLRKAKNLANNKSKNGHSPQPNVKKTPALNFGGKSNELWCDGGEIKFITNMAYESREFANQVLWFSTLLSKSENIKPFKQLLKKIEVEAVKVVEMKQGQKISRFVAWTFQNEVQRKEWSKLRC